MTDPTTSVVVPTRDRPSSLAACLRALEVQTAASFEIVVVDDASTDAGAVAAVVDGCAPARLVRGEGRGPAAARNRGAGAARGRVLCFTDDDCRPDPAWAEALTRRVLAGGVGAVAGPTRNGRPDDPFAAASQLVTNHLTDHAGTDDGVDFAPTSNLAVRAEVFASLPFDERFPLAAGEDREWCDRLARTGTRLAFEPGAVVWHHQELGPRGFWRQQHRYGRGAHHLRSGAGDQHQDQDQDQDLQPASFYLGLLRRGWRESPAVGALVVAAQVATATGIAREALRARTRHR